MEKKARSYSVTITLKVAGPERREFFDNFSRRNSETLEANLLLVEERQKQKKGGKVGEKVSPSLCVFFSSSLESIAMVLSKRVGHKLE